MLQAYQVVQAGLNDQFDVADWSLRLPREAEFDEALDRFCAEWNRGGADEARFEKEYLLAVGTRM
jgi:hypothetical protein